MKNSGLVEKAAQRLVNLEMANGGRWCNITIRKTKEVLTLVRTGYGPHEYPQGDSHTLKDSQGKVLNNSTDIWEMAKYILNNF